MRILVDGDACPSKDVIVKLAKKYNLEVIVFMDYAHNSNSLDYQIVMCEVKSDSVDLKIVNALNAGDIVITQDYGLASLVLGKRGKVLHVGGKVINTNNVDELLMSRYLSAKARKAGVRVKGPAKRTKEDECYFESQLEKMILEII